MAKKSITRRWVRMGAAGVMGALMASCGGPKSGIGFSLPDGNVDRGRAAFVRLQCTQCHTVAGETFTLQPKVEGVNVPLGGEVVRVKTYGQLVTSIIYPQHIVSPKYVEAYTDAEGRSLMPVMNDTMTVAELIDMVAFLQVHYRLKPPEPAYYPYP